MMPAMTRSSAVTTGRPWRTLATVLSLVVMLALLLAPLAAAQDGPRYAERVDDAHIADQAKVFTNTQRSTFEERLQVLAEETGIDVVVYTQEKAKVGAHKGAQEEAAALLAEWGVGGESGEGAVILWNVSEDRSITRSGVALGAVFSEAEAEAVDEIVNSAIRTSVRERDWRGALDIGLTALEDRLVVQAVPTPTPTPTPRAQQPGQLRPTTTAGSRPTDVIDPPAGPPYPDPFDGITVYDFAKVISPDVRDRLESTIERIEARTGAEVAVYTQVKPSAENDPAGTERDAVALIDQWGIGRAGFDDGLVIFFNLTEDLCHGQVQLYAAPGYAAAYLTNAERQAIYEEQMLPGASRVRLRCGHAQRPARDRCRRDRRARAQPAAGAPGRCRGRAHPGAAAAGGAGGLGRLVVAALRARPHLPRRRVDPDAGSAAGHVAGCGRGDPGRTRQAARADHGPGGPGRSRRDHLPGGRGRALQDGHRHHRARPARCPPGTQPPPAAWATRRPTRSPS